MLTIRSVRAGLAQRVISERRHRKRHVVGPAEDGGTVRSRNLGMGSLDDEIGATRRRVGEVIEHHSLWHAGEPVARTVPDERHLQPQMRLDRDRPEQRTADETISDDADALHDRLAAFSLLRADQVTAKSPSPPSAK